MKFRILHQKTYVLNQFRDGYVYDYDILSNPNFNLSERQKYITDYSYDKAIEYEENKCAYDEVFAEDFAECIKLLLLKNPRLNLFTKKSEFINTII